MAYSSDTIFPVLRFNVDFQNVEFQNVDFQNVHMI
jgi:hypothetical protein